MTENQLKIYQTLEALVHEVKGLGERIATLEPRTFLPAIESLPNPNNFVNRGLTNQIFRVVFPSKFRCGPKPKIGKQREILIAYG